MTMDRRCDSQRAAVCVQEDERMNVTVLSDGAWGTALALVLRRNGHRVTIWGPFPEYLREMAETRVNARFLPGVRLDDELRFEPDMAAATTASEWILLATPTQFLRGVLEKFLPCFRPERQILLNVAKGIEVNSWLRVSEITRQVLGESRYVVLSGPSHAEEVSRGVPTAVVAASTDAEAAGLAQKLFMNEVFRVYTSGDPLGVELGGALKNVMAIAAGIIDGMRLGDNPKAAMMTRAIAEMSRLGVMLGGRAQTFSGLSGVGDLIVTCMSRHSRNRYVGEELGKGRGIDEIIRSMGMVVAEGVKTSESMCQLARKIGVETPVANTIYDIIYHGKSPKDAVLELMTRKAKHETE